MTTIEKIRQKIQAGQFQEVRQEVEERLEQDPDNQQLQRVWEVIQPSEVETVEMSDEEREKLQANHHWLETHTREYGGQWVALDGGELVESAETFHQLHDQVDLRDNDYLVTVVHHHPSIEE